jgi:ferritin-like metal-binding protein YciE
MGGANLGLIEKGRYYPMPQMSMQTPQDLFVHELSDMLSAEQIILQTLTEGQQLVQNPQIQQGMQKHQQETEQQIQNLQQAFQQLGAQPHPITCHAAAGLRQSLQDVVASQPSPEVLEGAVVAGMAKTEHLEIAGYTGLVKKAQAMGQQEVAQLLQQNLQQEEATLQRVERVAEQLTQQMAATSPEMAATR